MYIRINTLYTHKKEKHKSEKANYYAATQTFPFVSRKLGSFSSLLFSE